MEKTAAVHKDGRLTKIWERIWWLPVCLLAAFSALLSSINSVGPLMPEWLAYVCIAGLTVLCIVMWKTHAGSRIMKILLTLAAAAAGIFCWLGVYCNPYWNSSAIKPRTAAAAPDASITGAQAKEDLDFAWKYLQKVHPAFLMENTEALTAKYENLAAEFAGAEQLRAIEAARGIQTLLAGLHDAHTGLTLNYPDMHIAPNAKQHVNAGDELKAVNGTSLDELLSEYGDLISTETEGWGKVQLQEYLLSLEGLQFLGIDPAEVTYTWQAGDEEVEEMATAAQFMPLIPIAQSATDLPAAAWHMNAAGDAAILTLPACVNNAAYTETLVNMFTAVKEKGIQKVIVDLRENGGGELSAATEFLKYLPADWYRQFASEKRYGPFLDTVPEQDVQNAKYYPLTFDGDLDVLTSPKTFSSAAMFAAYIQDNDLGTIIGEPPGSAADGWGDVSVFTLPNTGFEIGISSKKWGRQASAENIITPQIEVRAPEALAAAEAAWGS